MAPISPALSIKGADAREYELSVDIRWDAERWTITSEAWVEHETRNQEMIRQLPDRTATSLSACMEQIEGAIEDLVGFEDLVPREAV